MIMHYLTFCFTLKSGIYRGGGRVKMQTFEKKIKVKLPCSF
jgi:hypothetical protein